MITSEPPRILLVEEDDEIRRKLCDILGLRGYQVTASASGEEALERLHSVEYDCVLTDLELEGVSGLEVVREVREHYPDTEVIVAITCKSQEAPIESTNLGVFGYSLKPVDVEHVLLLIGRAVEKREARLALRESEERYRAVFENSGTAMLTIEEDTSISLVNHGFEVLSGYSREEIEGKKSWVEFVAERDLTRMKDYHGERRRGEPAPRE